MKGMKKMAMAKKMAGMKKMAMRKSIIGKRAAVFRGNKDHTKGGLKKGDLMKNKRGKIVTKKQNARGKKNFARISKWTAAFKAARKALGIKGFCPCGGSSAKGKALLAKTRSLYKK